MCRSKSEKIKPIGSKIMLIKRYDNIIIIYVK